MKVPKAEQRRYVLRALARIWMSDMTRTAKAFRMRILIRTAW